MRARLVAAIVVGLASSSGPASASTDPYADAAAAIACPSAPAGWSNPTDGGRSILTPLTTGISADNPNEAFGGYAAEVDCHYFTPGGKQLEVSVRYALPIDINPFNDFDIGCTVNDFAAGVPTGAHAWNDRDRVYRVVGETSWSYATFYDYLSSLAPSDVGPFEGIARAMLGAAQANAHKCLLAGGGRPATLQTIWDFGFTVRTTSAGVTSSGSSTGSFETGTSVSGSTGVIGKLHASDLQLHVTKADGRTSAIAIRVGDPIDFHYFYGAILRADVAVVASTDASCRTGSTGTLSVSTFPRVFVKICGRTYLGGQGKVDAHIISV